MCFYLISDNTHTQLGLRLAGIDGVVVHTADEAARALTAAAEREDVGLILVTQLLAKQFPQLWDRFKETHSRPLLLEIPDRHNEGDFGSSLNRYVRESLGIKL